MAKGNALDQVISFFSPSLALRRERARLALQVLSGARHFEAASKGRRTQGWIAPGTDANAAASNALVNLRNRSRDLVRNNGYAAKAVQVIVENTVGTGILCKPTSKATGKVRQANEAWKLWADNVNCDQDRVHDFYGIQALVMREVAEAGEIIVRRIKTVPTEAAPIPLKLQLLEGDYLDHMKSERLKGGGYIVQGVEFDAQGNKVAYWLFDEHPGDMLAATSASSKRYPESDIAHIYRVDRASQVRGVPFGASAMLPLRDFEEYEDAQIIRQKVAACFSAFVYDSEMPAELGQGQLPVDKVEPGMIEYLPPGKDIKFGVPPGVDGYGEFSKQMLHKVAAGYGVTYEALTGDFSQVNFSSGRMGWLEFQRNIESWRWRMLIPRLCDQVWEWFLEAAFLAGYNLDGVVPVWTPPRREMIDPNKEIGATITAIRGGLMTLSEAIRQNGYDPVEVLNERAADDALLDNFRITLDSDPRATTGAGMAQMDPGANQAADVGGSQTP